MRRVLTILLLFVGASCVPAEQAEAPVTTTTTTTTVPSPTEVIASFDECAAAAGAAFPQLTLDAAGRPDIARLVLTIDPLDETTREVFSECASVLTGALPLEGDRKGLVTSALLGFAQCMREEGVLSFPDPVLGFDGTGDPFEIDPVTRQTPGFTEAAELCASLLGGGER